MTFRQLKIYYEGMHKELNDQFATSLELLNEDGSYNYVAYLMADENGMSIKAARYIGLTRVDLAENNEYGYCCLVKGDQAVVGQGRGGKQDLCSYHREGPT